MMPINPSVISIADRYVQEYFGLTLPITAEMLKSAFRKTAKQLHTDTSGDESTKHKFIQMKDAYDYLVKLDGMDFVYGERAVKTGQLITTDGAPLYELGLGLGPMKNGRDCERCAHKGYTEEANSSHSSCYRCHWTGQVLQDWPCRPCKGTGQFRQARTGRLVVCLSCDGRGEVHRRGQCPDCHGTKRIGPVTVYHRCYECKGTGEIELFSPVLPKGRLINSNRR